MFFHVLTAYGAKGKPQSRVFGCVQERNGIQAMGFWILGAGKFGRIAAERIREKHPPALITVVDNDQDALDALDSGVEALHMPGGEFLFNALSRENAPDWIVPAIPVHMAYEWIMARLEREKSPWPLPVPFEIADQVPNPLWGQQGTLYASQADFLCPDNCPEPEHHCFKTGLPRENLFDIFRRMQAPGYTQVVIQSYQLTPGVGGIKPDDLFLAEKQVLAASGPVLVCTACRCHGVINGLELT
ncbi:MAG: potassium transporter [Desulfatibacillum sp.]|nr:potassium transporter [Desulfatibacillum sp.]